MTKEENDRLSAMKTHAMTHAEMLSAIRRPRWFARPLYEYLSDGLVWSDETNVSFDAINVLRPLFHHRSVLILGKDDDTWAEYWRGAQELFPNWIGFLPSRRKSSVKLRKLIRAGRLKMLRECWQLKQIAENNSGGIFGG